MLAVSGADQAPKVFQSTYGWPHHIPTWWEGEIELGKGLMFPFTKQTLSSICC